MPRIDPRDVSLSRHFRLSDFLGNHSVYARGLANPFVDDEDTALRLRNARALCEEGLEPTLERFGPLSVAYGYISPEFSRATIRYQDPDKPSHHRWDLGAAADFIAHRWVQGLPQEPAMMQLFADKNTATSPALLAHALEDELNVPFSRLITYSESPCICLAISAAELAENQPRRAFYENRYQGRPKVKPEYISQPSLNQRQRIRAQLQEQGLEHPWFGEGYPTHHGGGIQQYQHVRVSRYTTVLDWLFNLKSISNGIKNIPALMNEQVQDSFAAAGIVYDALVERAGIPRMSVLQGFVSRTHPDFHEEGNWWGEDIFIELAYGFGNEDQEHFAAVASEHLPGYISIERTARGLALSFNVFRVLEDQDMP